MVNKQTNRPAAERPQQAVRAATSPAARRASTAPA